MADVASDLQNQGQQAYVQIDREAAGRLGVTVAEIDTALYNAFGQRLISTIYTQASQYRVVLEAATGARRGLAALEGLYLPGVTTTAANGTTSTTQVPLSAVAKVVERPVALAVNHVAQFPSATVSFNLASGVSLGAAVDAIKAEEARLDLPPSVETSFQGAAEAFRASLSSTLLLILAAVVTMYIVLGVLYESYIHPVTILSTLPSAGLGALLALMLARQDLGIVAVIGIILLIGIVKKNAIMMVDFALDAERVEGKAPRDAIHQACLLRFRPILMTTMSALLAALPLMLGIGRRPRAAPPAGRDDGRWPDREPAAHAVHHTGDLPRLRQSGAAPEGVARKTAPLIGSHRGSGCAMNVSAPFIARPIGTTLITIGVALAGVLGFRAPADRAAAAGGHPDDLGQCVAARREPRHDGGHGGCTARAGARQHRRRH